MRDTDTIQRVLTTLDTLRSNSRRNVMATALFSSALLLAGTGATVLGAGTPLSIGGAAAALGGVIGLVNQIYSGTIGIDKQYTKSVYSQMANLFGRDCINFSTLFYHGAPYMSGFDGVDYSNIQTVINQQLAGEGLITRLASAGDTELAWILSSGDFSQLGFFDKLGLFFPIIGNIQNRIIQTTGQRSNTTLGNGVLNNPNNPFAER